MKTFSTLLILFFSIILTGQSLSLSESDIELEFGAYMDYNTIQITNNSSSTVELAGTLEPECYIEGDDTNVQICLGDKCFLAVTTTTTWGMNGNSLITLTPSASSGIIKFTPSTSTSNLGSKWKLHLFDRNDITNVATLSLSIDQCSTTSTTDYLSTLGAAYPNPANDVINIPLLENKKANSIDIYNVIGKLTESIDVSDYQNTYSLNTSILNSGIYFYNIVDSENLKSRMYTFVKK